MLVRRIVRRSIWRFNRNNSEFGRRIFQDRNSKNGRRVFQFLLSEPASESMHLSQRKQAMISFLGLVAIAGLLSIGCDRAQPISQPTNPEERQPTPAPPPLIEATLAGNLEDVRSQLQAGTDPNLVYRTNTALTYAARDGFTEIARLLLDSGADVNWIDGEGVTPLILASFKGHENLVRLLLERGAEIDIQDQWNRTALDYALRRGETDAIAKLLQQASQE